MSHLILFETPTINWLYKLSLYLEEQNEHPKRAIISERFLKVLFMILTSSFKFLLISLMRPMYFSSENASFLLMLPVQDILSLDHGAHTQL